MLNVTMSREDSIRMLERRGSESSASAGKKIRMKILWDFPGREDTDLELRAGDFVTLISQQDGDWCFGETEDGRQGYYPKLYAEIQAEVSTEVQEIQNQIEEEEEEEQEQEQEQQEVDKEQEEEAEKVKKDLSEGEAKEVEEAEPTRSEVRQQQLRELQARGVPATSPISMQTSGKPPLAPPTKPSKAGKSMDLTADLTARPTGVKELNDRNRVIDEIVVTEHNYSRYMNTILLICKPMMEKELSDSEARDIFSNVEQLVKFNQIFLPELRKAAAADDEMIGKVYKQFSPFFKMYGAYCGSHTKASQTIEEVSKKRKAFQRVLDKCQANPACRGQNIQSLMIMPIQRVPRHKLLLKELLKHTDKSHPDFTACQDALENISVVASHVNEHIRVYQNIIKVWEIQKSMAPRPEIFNQGCQYIRSGMLKKANHDGHIEELMFWLFNDCLVYATPKTLVINNVRYKYRRTIQVASVVPDDAVLTLDEAKHANRRSRVSRVSRSSSHNKSNVANSIGGGLVGGTAAITDSSPSTGGAGVVKNKSSFYHRIAASASPTSRRHSQTTAVDMTMMVAATKSEGIEEEGDENHEKSTKHMANTGIEGHDEEEEEEDEQHSDVSDADVSRDDVIDADESRDGYSMSESSAGESLGKSRSSTVDSELESNGSIEGSSGGGGSIVAPSVEANDAGGAAVIRDVAANEENGSMSPAHSKPMGLPPALPATREEPKLYPFRVIATKSLVLYARSEGERTKWIDALTECSNPEVKSDAARKQDLIDASVAKEQEKLEKARAAIDSIAAKIDVSNPVALSTVTASYNLHPRKRTMLSPSSALSRSSRARSADGTSSIHSGSNETPEVQVSFHISRTGTDLSTAGPVNSLSLMYLTLTVIGAKGLAVGDSKKGTSDTYCVVTCGKRVNRTKVCKASLEPVWYEQFRDMQFIAGIFSAIQVEVFHDQGSLWPAVSLGVVSIPTDKMLEMVGISVEALDASAQGVFEHGKRKSIADRTKRSVVVDPLAVKCRVQIKPDNGLLAIKPPNDRLPSAEMQLQAVQERTQRPLPRPPPVSTKEKSRKESGEKEEEEQKAESRPRNLSESGVATSPISRSRGLSFRGRSLSSTSSPLTSPRHAVNMLRNNTVGTEIKRRLFGGSASKVDSSSVDVEAMTVASPKANEEEVPSSCGEATAL